MTASSSEPPPASWWPSRLPALDADRALLAAGGLGLLASALLGWLATPLQGGLKGYSFPLLGEVLLSDARTHPLRPLSFGGAALVLGCLSAVAAWRRWLRGAFWLGAAAVLLALYFAGTIALWRSEILEAVVDQNDQRRNVKLFDRMALKGVAAHLAVRDLGTGSLADRLWSGLSVYGFGWQLAVGSGLFLQAWTLARARRRLAWHAGVFLGLALLLLVGAGGRAGVAEYWVLRGEGFKARGQFLEAREAYERALDWNRALDRNPTLQHRLGEVYAQLGQGARPQTHIYRGNVYLERNQFDHARQAFEQALALRPDHPVAQSRLVDARVAAGLGRYRSGEPHKAIAEWEQALQLDGSQIQVPFFLGRAYFDVRRDWKAIEAGEAALARTGDVLVRADLFIVLGDAYYRLREFVLARQMYRTSLDQYPSVTFLLNWQARQRLQGI